MKTYVNGEIYEEGNGLGVKAGEYAYDAESGTAYRIVTVWTMSFRSEPSGNHISVICEEIGDASAIPESKFDDCWNFAPDK